MATQRLRREKRSGRSDKTKAVGGYKVAFFCMLFSIAIPCSAGVEGSSFFYMSFYIASAFILLFPFALSQVCNRMIRVRHGAGGDRAAGAVRKACLSIGITYSIAALILTVIFKEPVTEKLLPGNGSVNVFFTLAIAFFVGAIYLILNAAVDPYLRHGETSDIADAGALLMPAAGIVVYIFSLSKSRMTASLLDNATSGKAVFSSGLAVGVLIAGLFLFLRTLLLYISHSKRIDKIISKDRAKLREPGFILSFQAGVRHFASMLPSICLLPALVIVFGICLRIRGSEALFLYDSGLFLLLVSGAFSFPFLYSITYFSRESYMLSRAYNVGEHTEVWNRINIILKTVFPCGVYFSAWFLAASSSIVPCILRERSMAGARLLYFIAPLIPLAAISAGLLYILLSIDKTGLSICSTFVPLALSLIFCYIIGSKTDAGVYVLPAALSIYIIIALAVRIVFVFYTVDVRLPYKYFGEVLFCAFIAGAAMKILSLLTGLIKLPDIATALITAIAGFAVFFILLCNARLLTVYTVKDQPMGKFLFAAGKRFRIIHKNERE